MYKGKFALTILLW